MRKIFVKRQLSEFSLDVRGMHPHNACPRGLRFRKTDTKENRRNTFISRYWFLSMLVMMIPAGLWLPEGGIAVNLAGCHRKTGVDEQENDTLRH